MKLLKKASVSMALILFIVFLYVSGTIVATIGIALFSFGSLYEFYGLCERLKLKPIKWLGLVSSLFLLYEAYRNNPIGMFHILLFTLFFILLKLVLDKRHFSTALLDASVTIFGLVYVSICMSVLVLVCNLKPVSDGMPCGIDFFIFIVLCNSFCDMSANGIGSWIGRTKFLTHVSPNKTVEGTIGGIVGALVAATIMGYFIKFPFPHFLIVGFCIGVAGIIGDFSESLIKRNVGVKDAGAVFVEHGGMLDRCDSLFLSSFLSYIYLIYVFYNMKGLSF